MIYDFIVVAGLQGDCPLGEYGMDVEACRTCFCFGVTDKCEPLDMAYDKVTAIQSYTTE